LAGVAACKLRPGNPEIKTANVIREILNDVVIVNFVLIVFSSIVLLIFVVLHRRHDHHHHDLRQLSHLRLGYRRP
jgi:hypothetical protein